MNINELMGKVVFPQLRKIIPGIIKIQLANLPGTWFTLPSSAICYVVTESDRGDFVLKISNSSIYTPNETHVFDAIEDLIDYIAENVTRLDAIPREGRFIGRAEQLEKELGTLTGLNLQAELNPYDETEEIDGAITEAPVDREYGLKA